MTEQLAPEDQKLVTLAKATRARTGADEGAAVRDLDGRTYAAATVALPSLSVSALGVCVAMAVASGSRGLEAAVLLTDAGAVGADDLAVLRDFAGVGVPVHVGDPRGSLGSSQRT
ncbi:cytidine deaminase [Nocardioides sp.]|uniref:cytidine deaminase n=1 Tax=Nocardioides sp. TaxID=35761 RepID=UPI001A18F4D9|nr:cytidine deaminase [Nocardioides sp.]MBJ7358196.1 cytidine deaminase [Nocardioides sp.]